VVYRTRLSITLQVTYFVGTHLEPYESSPSIDSVFCKVHLILDCSSPQHLSAKWSRQYMFFWLKYPFSPSELYVALHIFHELITLVMSGDKMLPLWLYSLCRCTHLTLTFRLSGSSKRSGRCSDYINLCCFLTLRSPVTYPHITTTSTWDTKGCDKRCDSKGSKRSPGFVTYSEMQL
jgi:hypothetical protein